MCKNNALEILVHVDVAHIDVAHADMAHLDMAHDCIIQYNWCRFGRPHIQAAISRSSRSQRCSTKFRSDDWEGRWSTPNPPSCSWKQFLDDVAIKWCVRLAEILRYAVAFEFTFTFTAFKRCWIGTRRVARKYSPHRYTSTTRPWEIYGLCVQTSPTTMPWSVTEITFPF